MEKELSELRAQLESRRTSPARQLRHIKGSGTATGSMSASPTGIGVSMQSSIDQYIGSQEAVASLMDLKSGVEGGGGGAFLRGANGGLVPSRRIEGVVLAQERIRHLFLK